MQASGLARVPAQAQVLGDAAATMPQSMRSWSSGAHHGTGCVGRPEQQITAGHTVTGTTLPSHRHFSGGDTFGGRYRRA
ncbi:hypothetical protein GY45DRAFT_1017659 [Cubamyces sp. BRFM 1775]|nr:hypothetical protein GY45DRAFT_1017659 [Cubamyces sp. BRFM 1775]